MFIPVTLFCSFFLFPVGVAQEDEMRLKADA